MAFVTRNIRGGTLIVTDGNAQTLTLDLEDSGLSWEMTDNVINVLDRGVLSHMRPGDEAPVTGNIGLKFKRFVGTNVTTPTLVEALTRTSNAANWSSTNTDGGDVYTMKLVFEIAAVGTTLAEEVTFAMVCPQGAIAFAEGDEWSTLSCAFQDFETAPSIRQIA